MAVALESVVEELSCRVCQPPATKDGCQIWWKSPSGSSPPGHPPRHLHRPSEPRAAHFDEREPFGLVIVTTLAHQVDALLPALQRSQARCVHFMFVTPEAERLRSAVGVRRATFGMGAVLAALDSDGKLGLTIPRTKAMQGDQRWVDLFQAAGMPSAREKDMGRWLRSQTPLTIAMEGVAVAGMRHKRGATWAEAKTGARGLRAGFSILRELGETPYPGSKNQISRAPRFLLTLILRTVSRSRFRETVGNSSEECRGLVDLLTAEAEGKPALRKAVDAVLALRPDGTTQIRPAAGVPAGSPGRTRP